MLATSPKISVLMPVYNGGNFLRPAIQSILSQSFTDFEFLIINDGSGDDSESTILSFTDSRIAYHKNAINKGIVATLNLGIELAKGKYIARMDADDFSYPERFKLQYEFMENNPDVGVCGAQLKVMDSDTVIPYPVEHNEIFSSFLQKNGMAHPVVMFRKQIMIDCYLQYKANYFPAEDFMLWVDFARVSKLHNLPVCLLDYKIHPTSVSVSNKASQMEKLYDIRSFFILDALACYTGTYHYYVKTSFAFLFEEDITYLLNLKQAYNCIITQNLLLHKVNHNELCNLLSAYWYVASKKALNNGFKVLQIYSSLSIFKIQYLLKLLFFYIIRSYKKAN